MFSIWVTRGKLLPPLHVCPTKAQQKRNHVQKSFGCSSDEATLDALERKTRQWAAMRCPGMQSGGCRNDDDDGRGRSLYDLQADGTRRRAYHADICKDCRQQENRGRRYGRQTIRTEMRIILIPVYENLPAYWDNNNSRFYLQKHELLLSLPSQ